ncbi:CCC motif membrane protein [Maribacter sp. 2210JD10-5]|uniref:CCC motif membrane protein n=1 Tax=Maribacter sp. 2210JD10-5 TaxID=3386272 RepID=UPI0039BC5AF2
MEQQKLPNVTIVIVLSILGFVCCCFAGLPGILLGGIAFFLASKDEKTYKENPEGYSNYSTLKTAKIISIVVLVLGILYFAWSIFSIFQMGGWDAYMEQIKTMTEQYQ